MGLHGLLISASVIYYFGYFAICN